MKFILSNILIISGLVCSSCFNAMGQMKNLQALRIDDKLELDGLINEPFWKDVQVAENFFQNKPYNGAPAGFDINARIVYDDYNIYVGAFIQDHPDSISMGMGNRDTRPKADNLTVWLDTYNDNLNAWGFRVYASNIQRDLAISPSGYDISWDAVWYSETAVQDSGWSVEIQIPYSALRFSAKEEHTWGLNLYYMNYRTQEIDSWALEDQEVAGFVNQFGNLKGLKSIKPPVRMAFMPYVAGYADKFTGSNFKYSYKAGMDVKYGISESFTLDMMLIPDFGQVQSDNLILDLGPYEVQYREKRPFFTEGASLFQTAGIFYSKRIGAEPINYDEPEDDLIENEVIVNNPATTSLINATKISGKTKSGLSLGVINAITENTYALIDDTLTGASRKYKTQPLTNYSAVVAQQVLKNNSHIGLANTNMIHQKGRANVSGVSLNLKNRANTYEAYGDFVFSHRKFDGDDTENGYYYEIGGRKLIGNFRFDFSRNYYGDSYNINDMGFSKRNNYSENRCEFEYLTLDPFWKIYRSSNKLSAVYRRRVAPSDYLNFYLLWNSSFTFNNYSELSLEGWIRPYDQHDYDETRTKDRYFLDPKQCFIEVEIETNERKKFSIETSVNYKAGGDYNYRACGFEIAPRVVLSDQLNLRYLFSMIKNLNSRNYVGKSEDETVIYFGERDAKSVNNQLEGSFVFSSDAYLNLKVRHYWTEVQYDKFFRLNENGSLSPDEEYDVNEDINLNRFNIDLSYTWRFAPGSELILMWKNAIFVEEDNRFFNSYLDNLDYSLGQDQLNSLSVKVLYYLDYNKLNQRFYKSQ